MDSMSDTKPEVDVDILLTPRERAVVNGAMATAEGIAALAHGAVSEAAERFAAAAWWQSVARQTEADL